MEFYRNSETGEVRVLIDFEDEFFVCKIWNTHKYTLKWWKGSKEDAVSHWNMHKYNPTTRKKYLLLAIMEFALQQMSESLFTWTTDYYSPIDAYMQLNHWSRYKMDRTWSKIDKYLNMLKDNKKVSYR